MKKLLLGALLLLSTVSFSQNLSYAEPFLIGINYSNTTESLGFEFLTKDEEDIWFGFSVRKTLKTKSDNYEKPDTQFYFISGFSFRNERKEFIFTPIIGMYNIRENNRVNHDVEVLYGTKLTMTVNKIYYSTSVDNVNGVSLSLGVRFN